MWSWPRRIFFVLNFLVSSLVTARSAAQDIPSSLIYGNDNRREAIESSFSDKINSVAAKIPLSTLDSDQPLKTLRQQKNLCADEDARFAEQHPLATCSGVLIAPRLLLTAGHCMVTQQDCDENAWAFGWTVEQKKPNNIVKCQRIVAQQWFPGNDKKADYALVLLHHNPAYATPAKLRHGWYARVGTDLTMLGHPLGLPMKATDHATVTLLNRNKIGPLAITWDLVRRTFTRERYYNTNLDSFAGNSGSPVFNDRTGVIEGILISGGEDFDWDQYSGCRRYVRDGRHALASGEKVLRPAAIPGIWNYIQEALDESLK